MVGAGIGNAVEWFDFAVYGLMAVTMAKLFFPSTSEASSLLTTFAVFGIAFFLRPLGGVVFGIIGDRIGRRATLSIAILIMCGCTALIGVLPTHATAGVVASILLVACRLGQGFAAGGEFAGAAAFLVEHAPRKKRGLFSSFLVVSTSVGLLLALGVVTVVSVWTGPAFEQWGWRLPFLLALPLGLIGLFIRLRLEDTPAFQELQENNDIETRPLRTCFSEHGRVMLAVFLGVIPTAVGFYILFTYLPTYIQQTTQLGRTVALITNSVAVVVCALCLPLFGSLSDRIGRRRVLQIGAAGFVVMPVPALMLASSGSISGAVVGQILLALPMAASASMTAAILVENFPPAVRYTGGSVLYNGAQVIFGATAPYVAILITVQTGSTTAPGFYIAGLCLISLIGVTLFLRETRTTDPAPTTASPVPDPA
ncbi:MFS transporter [Pseudonocardia sulfidoxydans NBRC 16205]|uniref:Putative proline/betaine transporter n=1 Tax=Pseudonocardia sulfidoxydans NBRC 16205 TaxID=1223511 RepID=A0A511DL95_9PSEU|nr:MFS transporter [Pseudonocardia sulfidoxydans]GEL25043.1 MFS transporter [Pseudonocardia sulfidoxydans NBRC 16205]